MCVFVERRVSQDTPRRSFWTSAAQAPCSGSRRSLRTSTSTPSTPTRWTRALAFSVPSTCGARLAASCSFVPWVGRSSWLYSCLDTVFISMGMFCLFFYVMSSHFRICILCRCVRAFFIYNFFCKGCLTTDQRCEGTRRGKGSEPLMQMNVRVIDLIEAGSPPRPPCEKDASDMRLGGCSWRWFASSLNLAPCSTGGGSPCVCRCVDILFLKILCGLLFVHVNKRGVA